MRLLLLSPHYGDLAQSGSLRSSQIAEYLAGRGHEVVVVAPGVDLRSGRNFEDVDRKNYDDRRIRKVRLIRPSGVEDFRRSMLRRLWFEVHFAAKATSIMLRLPRPDVVIGAYPPAVLPYVGLVLAKLWRVPFIFEVRDLMADALAVNRYSKIPAFHHVAAFLERLAYRYSDHVVTVSDGIRRIIIEKGFPGNKVTSIKNAFEPQVFADPDYSFDPRKEYGWGDRFVAIYAGALTQSYDIPTMLRAAEAAREDPRILFVILGEGERKSSYQEFCRDHDLNNVQFLDVVPRRLIPAILSRANVGLHMFPDNPLWSYVLGNKPFDYLGSGIPMIYCGTGDTADLVTAAGAGFVIPPERADELYRTILWLLQNASEARIMGRRGRDYVRVHFNRFDLLRSFDVVLDSIGVIGVAVADRRPAAHGCGRSST